MHQCPRKWVTIGRPLVLPKHLVQELNVGTLRVVAQRLNSVVGDLTMMTITHWWHITFEDAGN